MTVSTDTIEACSPATIHVARHSRIGAFDGTSPSNDVLPLPGRLACPVDPGAGGTTLSESSRDSQDREAVEFAEETVADLDPDRAGERDDQEERGVTMTDGQDRQDELELHDETLTDLDPVASMGISLPIKHPRTWKATNLCWCTQYCPTHDCYSYCGPAGNEQC
ncbi:MAG: hypothetical protein L0I76_25220 [Pseudonocardia sp.]|nr:hypothetical protein [Pseudonocardia sp.]